ncbi:MAG: TonB-dependent receptor plug [Myxococcales bacterium]|nr:TonB-dependent receptor plug [Myxococcales bacterium]
MKIANKALMAAALAGLAFLGGSLVDSTAAHAQSGATVGSLRGVIKDKANGEGAAGATVVATSPSLQGEQVVITDETGQYFVTSLPPGVYTLTVYYNDGTFSRGNIVIQVGKEAVVNVTVDSASQAGKPKGETIVITGNAPIIDQGSTKTGLTITDDYTRNIPTGRTFGGVIGQAAGAQTDTSAQGSGISFAGSTSLENTYIVEGINTTDTGYGGLSANLPNEFIQETEVITGGYNAEYGRATGGIVNVVTKSGSNQFHGSIFGYIRPGALVSDAKLVEREGGSIAGKNDLDYGYDFGAEVGGPIIKDKLWFHVGFNPSFVHSTQTRIVQSQVDKNMDGVPDIDPATGFTQHEFVNSSTQPIKSSTYFFTGKINGAINQNNQFQVSAFGNPESTNSVYGLTRNPAYSLINTDIGAYDVSAKWTSKLNEGKTQIDAVVGYHHGYQYDRPLNATQGQAPEVYYNYGRSLYDFADLETAGGGIGKCQDGGPNDPYPNIRNCPVTAYVESGLGYLEEGDKNRTSAVVSLTQRVKLAGYHVFKLGLDTQLATFNAKKSYSGGDVWRRSANTATGAPGRWQDRAFLTVVRNLTNAEAADPSSVTLAPGQILCAGDRAICANATSISADTNDTNYGAFIQDSWQIRPNLTLDLGVRWEDQIGYAGKALQGQVTPDGEIVPSQVYNLNNLIAPRVGFIYDPTQEGRAKIFGHWGRFYENVPMDLQVREFGGEYIGFTNYNQNRRIPDSQGYDPNCNIDRNGGNVDIATLKMCTDKVLVTTTGGPAEFVSPGLKGQYTDELIFGTEYEIMADLKLGLNYIHRTLPVVIEDVSTDGGNTYLITNPGSNFDTEAATLHAQAMQEMASTDAQTRALGALHEGRSQQLYYTKNFEKPVRNYDGVQLTATQRPTKRSLLLASYTFSQSRGNYPGLFSTETGQADPNITSLYDLPDLMANRYGPLGLDRPHNLKVDGFYQFDLKQAGIITTGVSYRAQSGIAHNVLGASPHPGYGTGESYLLPRGALQRSPVTTQTDIHVSYGRRLDKRGTTLDAFVDVFNLFNQQDQLNVDENYTLEGANPIVGGQMSDLNHLKTLDLSTGQELNASPVPNKNFGHTGQNNVTVGAALQVPRSVRLGLRLTF